MIQLCWEPILTAYSIAGIALSVLRLLATSGDNIQGSFCVSQEQNVVSCIVHPILGEFLVATTDDVASIAVYRQILRLEAKESHGNHFLSEFVQRKSAGGWAANAFAFFDSTIIAQIT